MARTKRQIRGAYEGVDSLSSFGTAEELEIRRDDLLRGTAAQTRLIREALPASADVFEVGSGSGRLLVDLARSGVLRSGVGVELAESRVQFARRWAEDEGLEQLAFSTGDALRTLATESELDSVICVTGTMGYFTGMDGAPGGAELCRLARRALKPRGLLVIELYPHPRDLEMIAAADGPIQLWRELPQPDPWRFYLSGLSLEDGVLTHQKTFIHRSSGEVDTGRSERLRLYDEDQLKGLLADQGFTDIALYAGWDASSLKPDSELMIATARVAY